MNRCERIVLTVLFPFILIGGYICEKFWIWRENKIKEIAEGERDDN